MKTGANGAAVLLVIICAVFAGYPQEPAQNSGGRAKDEKLASLLRPSDYAVYRANEMGGTVFKLLPGETGPERGTSFGTYYSFKDRTYTSYQISVVRGQLLVGGGWSYGFCADLGEREFREIDRTSPEAAYFLSYEPPKPEPDISSEIRRLRDIKVDGVTLTRQVVARVGHTYLLRSIDFDWADTAVVAHVLESSKDGSVTIVWKMLAEFPIPFKLFMPDHEMQKKVDAVLSKLQIPGLRVKVEENRILVINGKPGPDFEKLKEAIHEQKIQYRGLGYSTDQ